MNATYNRAVHTHFPRGDLFDTNDGQHRSLSGTEEGRTMSKNGTILVGTVGQGIMMSPDNGERWMRAGVSQGMHSDCICRAIVSDPRRPELVYAGTDMGLYRSEDNGIHWQLQNNPMKGSMVWVLTQDPNDPEVMFAGTGTPDTPGLFRSTDSGKSWEHRAMDIAEECINVGVPRFTGISVDPTDSRNVWAGLEVDGLPAQHRRWRHLD